MSKTVKIYAKDAFAGVLNKNGSYSKQTASQGQGITLGKDTSNANAIGRGYLDFDLSKIPKGATIEKVSLQLTSKINFDKNFNGSIRIERSSVISEANSTTYELLRVINTDPGYTGLNHTFEKEGYGYEITHQWLTEQVDSTKGTSLQLKLNHKSENSSIVRLDGSNWGTYLTIQYKSDDGGSEEPGGPEEPGNNDYIKITEFKIDSSEQTVSVKYEKTPKPVEPHGWRIGGFKLISEKHYENGGEGLFSIDKITSPNAILPVNSVLGI